MSLILRLNTWAFFLDIFGLVFLMLFIFVSAGLLVSIILIALCLVVLVFAISLHAQTNRKLRAYCVLRAKNAMHYRPESFESFFSAPCGRTLIKSVLRSLYQDYRQKYFQLSEAYYKGFFTSDTSKVIVVPFATSVVLEKSDNVCGDSKNKN